ncbi:MAG TPA: HK97 family phage prohead protease [Pseudonocardia sp.]
MSTGQLFTEQRAAEVVDLDITNSGFVAATAIPYNVKTLIGGFTEAFLPGSMTKSINEAARSLPLHLLHDDMAEFGNIGMPIGTAHQWNDDDTRLYGVWKFDDDAKAQRARSLATPDENGNAPLGYMSIRFQPIRQKWTYAKQWDPSTPEGRDHVDNTESRLVSVSLVSTPAYIGATVDWVRSAGAPNRDTGRRAVDEWTEYLEKIKAGPLT